MNETHSTEQVTLDRGSWWPCTRPKCPGRMRPWRGTDGHNGVEFFYTCDRCGRTS